MDETFFSFEILDAPRAIAYSIFQSEHHAPLRQLIQHDQVFGLMAVDRQGDAVGCGAAENEGVPVRSPLPPGEVHHLREIRENRRLELRQEIGGLQLIPENPTPNLNADK